MSTSSPLSDATNASSTQPQLPEGADILQELEKLRAELDSTKVLVAGFSKKRRKKKR
jgi:hypothetical protein